MNIHQKLIQKFYGNAINDMANYMLCRKHIAAGFHAEHFLNLKRYYRRAFLNAPFRKGF